MQLVRYQRDPFFQFVLSWRPNNPRTLESRNRKKREGKKDPYSKKMEKTPMSLTAILILFLLLSTLAASSPTTTTDDAQSPYKALADFNFPVGLLPKGALGYELDRANGKFSAFLNGSCSFSLEGSYELKYKSTISGYISENRLTNLSGISVKVLFLWLNIVEVVRDGDQLEFSVGIASASFLIDDFYESPQCGCGFDCDNGQVRKLKFNPFVSSM
ncbi:uncharacterized protein LOC122317950 [Carya illinoinensis]|uniref:Uncharacterized protein n=1 Tax=Carya illinoinensis TaxID=32201 RepID=A0A8T1PUD6_CARIL|nr:uncharacterized protein LOC122317950 [Carya illinoinensis]KAG6645031.1 hypothetical protein CIPAW_08G094300 [Carya illinoinensis]KAG6700093.1 hypothetical protein I3842_08G095200 [Carya illinoinensis]